MRYIAIVLGVVMAATLPAPSDAQTFDPEPPTDPIARFSTAKRIARDEIYAGHRKTLYCSCDYEHSGTSGGRIDSSQCGYKVRKSHTRGARLEWEHIMPASFFGQQLMCWEEGHRDCVNSKGKAYRGRKCCARVDDRFAEMEADLHNLAPSVGELNGDRSNLPYGEIDGEPRLYGQCDFEIGKPSDRFMPADPDARRVAEPADSIKGDVARVWLYMIKAYELDVGANVVSEFMRWHESDKPDEWEKERDRRIEAEQGNSNPYVHARPGS